MIILTLSITYWWYCHENALMKGILRVKNQKMQTHDYQNNIKQSISNIYITLKINRLSEYIIKKER